MSKGIFKKSVVAVLALAMVISSCVMAYAAPPEIGTAVTNKATLSVGKTLYNPNGKLSSQSFNYKIEKVEAKDGRTMQALTANEIPMPANDVVTINFTTDDVKDKTKVTKGTNFGEMTYTKPGYYLYKIYEQVPADADKVPGVTYDETSYFICVYVVENVDGNGNTQDSVKVQEITSWHNDKGSSANKPNLSEIAKVTDNGGSAAQTVAGDAEGVSFGKVNYTKFVNQTASSDVIVSKNVKGNLGDRDYAFAFTTVLEALNPGTTYTYTKTAQNGTTSDVTFTADTNGAATLEYTLKDDEQIRILDIPVGTTYLTTEAASNHIASYALSGTEQTPVLVTASQTNPAQDTALSCAKETVDVADGVVTEAFTNTRNLTTITGVPGMDVIAYALAAALIMLAGTVLLRRKYEEDITE